MRTRIGAGIVAGLVAGLVMALTMMGYKSWRGESIWSMPNLIAAVWLGKDVTDGTLCLATTVGFATHMATSALMGLITVPFIRELPSWRTVLVAVAYSLASYPFVFTTVLTWANPLMIRRTELAPMTAAHTLFGLALGLTYLAVQRGSRES